MTALAPALADDGPDGDRAQERLPSEVPTAPEVIDLEVAPVLRRAGHRPLLRRRRELRHTVTSCDAAHVVLAEILGVVLVTADARPARAPGTTCEVEVLR